MSSPYFEWLVYKGEVVVAIFRDESDADLFMMAQECERAKESTWAFVPKGPPHDIEELKAANQKVFQKLQKPIDSRADTGYPESEGAKAFQFEPDPEVESLKEAYWRVLQKQAGCPDPEPDHIVDLGEAGA